MNIDSYFYLIIRFYIILILVLVHFTYAEKEITVQNVSGSMTIIEKYILHAGCDVPIFLQQLNCQNMLIIYLFSRIFHRKVIPFSIWISQSRV